MGLFQKKQKPKEEVKQTTVLKDLAEEQAQQLQAATRIVNVKYENCCGCGCSEDDYTLEVPVDSSIQEGDLIKDYEVISKYWK